MSSENISQIQQQQIGELQKKLNNIESLQSQEIYKEPLRNLQEQMLQELYALRNQMADSIQKACEQQSKSGNVQISEENQSQIPKKQYDEIISQNKKLKYRISHLLKSLDEVDGGAPSTKKKVQIYTDSSIVYDSTNNLLKALFNLSGYSAEWILLDKQQIFSNQIKDLNPTGQFPFIQTNEGTISGLASISKFLFFEQKKLIGSGDNLHKAQIEQWINWTNKTLLPSVNTVNAGIFSAEQVLTNEWNEAFKDLKNYGKIINTELVKGNGWLVGGQLTFADVFVAIALALPFQTVLDTGFRKAMKATNDWAEKIYSIPEVKNIFGNITLCSKPLKPILKTEVQEQKKEKAPAAVPLVKKEEKKEEKKKDNVESLPETSFDLYSFKTLFVNHADKKGQGVDEFYKMLDWEGWSFWHLVYDIYEGEGAKIHVTSNLLNGFLSRAEHTNKYTFGRMCVLGEEPNLQIKGCWLMRGQEIPDGLSKEHAQFEYYKTRKLDPKNNKEDDQLVRDYFGGMEGDTIEGLKCQLIKWQK